MESHHNHHPLPTYYPPNPDELEGMACSTFALSGEENSAAAVHEKFMEFTDQLGGYLLLGINPKPLNNQQNLLEIRKQHLINIVKICHVNRFALARNNLFVCGGFRDKAVTPEHMWLEDRDANMTYDRFINTLHGSCVAQNSVGVDGHAFAPGCEGKEFKAHEIVRVKIEGYTAGQLQIIANLPAAYCPFLHGGSST